MLLAIKNRWRQSPYYIRFERSVRNSSYIQGICFYVFVIFSVFLCMSCSNTLTTHANMDFFSTFKSPKNNSIKKHNASIQNHLITRQVVEKHPRNDCSASGLVCPDCYQTKIEKRVVRRLSVSMDCLNTTQTISVFFPFYAGTLVFMD